jgi:hypothetical protein
MSVTETNCPAVNAVPLSFKTPAFGSAGNLTAVKLSGGLSFGSLNPKSAVFKTYGTFCAVATVPDLPVGA